MGVGKQSFAQLAQDRHAVHLLEKWTTIKRLICIIKPAALQAWPLNTVYSNFNAYILGWGLPSLLQSRT
jgi:hypothetical protein